MAVAEHNKVRAQARYRPTQRRGRRGRRRPGADLPITAMVFRRDQPVGHFTVQNLCASGGLFTGRSDLHRHDLVRVLLPLPGETEPIMVHGRVRQRARANNDLVALRMAFTHSRPGTEDAIQEAVLRAMIRGDQRARPAVLLVEDCEPMQQSLTDGIKALGRRVLTASTPLEAVNYLEDPEQHVDTALVDVSIGETDGIELMRYIAEAYPDVRRVLVEGAVRPSSARMRRARTLVQAVVPRKWGPPELQRALLS